MCVILKILTGLLLNANIDGTTQRLNSFFEHSVSNPGHGSIHQGSLNCIVLVVVAVSYLKLIGITIGKRLIIGCPINTKCVNLD